MSRVPWCLPVRHRLRRPPPAPPRAPATLSACSASTRALRTDITIPPTRRRGAAADAAATLTSFKPVGRHAEGLRDVASTLPRQPCLVLLVSDFLMPPETITTGLSALARHHVTPVVLTTMPPGYSKRRLVPHPRRGNRPNAPSAHAACLAPPVARSGRSAARGAQCAVRQPWPRSVSCREHGGYRRVVPASCRRLMRRAWCLIALLAGTPACAQIRAVALLPPSRTVGLLVGDTLAGTADITVGPDTRLDPTSLPAAGPIAPSIDITGSKAAVARVGEGTPLHDPRPPTRPLPHPTT